MLSKFSSSIERVQAQLDPGRLPGMASLRRHCSTCLRGSGAIVVVVANDLLVVKRY